MFGETLDANSWVVICTLAGVVAVLARLFWSRQVKTEIKLEECESDRVELWKVISVQGEKISNVEGRQQAIEEFRKDFSVKILEIHESVLSAVDKKED